MSNNLQSLKYSGGSKPTLSVLDQLLIPHEKVYIDIPGVEAAWGVIRSMQIRGRFFGVLFPVDRPHFSSMRLVHRTNIVNIRW